MATADPIHQFQIKNITTLGDVGLTGSQDVRPTQTTTYTITATNRFGSVTANATVTVNVIPPPRILSFTAEPPVSPAPGSPVILRCQAGDAVSLTIGGAVITGGSGTQTVNPTVDTTYTCIATGRDGRTESASLLVRVTQPPPPTAGPTVVIKNGPVFETSINVQDVYSVRCTPQVLAPIAEAIELAVRTVETEANSSNDNPIIIPEKKKVIHGGNFHGQPIALDALVTTLKQQQQANQTTTTIVNSDKGVAVERLVANGVTTTRRRRFRRRIGGTLP